MLIVLLLQVDNLAAGLQFHLNGGEPVAMSIPATEHSVMTAWRTEREAMENMIEHFGSGILACVMDSYDYVQVSQIQLASAFASVASCHPVCCCCCYSIVEMLSHLVRHCACAVQLSTQAVPFIASVLVARNDRHTATSGKHCSNRSVCLHDCQVHYLT